MFTQRRSVWQTLAPLLMFVASALFQTACSCQSAKLPSRNPSPCISQHERIEIAGVPSTAKTIVPGSTPHSFGVDAHGNPAVSVPLISPPGRAGLAPDLELRHVGSSSDGVAANFALTGAGAITHCKKSWALDREIAAVDFAADDGALCMDGHRLISVAQSDTTVEYRLWPDNQIKVVQFKNGEHSYFTAYYPSGEIVDFGRTPGSRPSAGGKPIAYLANEQRDARGNGIQYGYCFVKEGDDVKEFALDEIRYGSFAGDEKIGTSRIVSLVYGEKEQARTTYEGGLKFRQSLQLNEIRMSVYMQLVRQYELGYEQGETTGRTRLTSVQECAGNGECKLPTRFHYGQVEVGFEDIATQTVAPLSRFASPMIGDSTGDGKADWLVPDTVGFSTATNPVTEWRLAKNTGGAFDTEKVAFLQGWPVVADPQGADNPLDIQPELGTTLDYDQNGLNDILLHDVTGTRNNHIVLLAQADRSFKELDTQIPRPFPIGPAPEGLRSSAGAVHLASVDHDSVADLIQCSDHGDTLDTAALSTWKLHVWRPGGFDPQGTVIETLSSVPCGIDVFPVDINNDSATDLIVPGFVKQDGIPIELSGTYSVHQRQANGTWIAFDTGLPVPQNGRVIFADVNADSLPDAISADTSGRLWTRMNTGKGFAKTPIASLPWDALLLQSRYFHLAVPGDFNGDSRMDLLMPLVDAISPDIPRWVILQATDGANGHSFERVESGIPFEAELGDVVKLADPRMPRVADVTGDSADDVLIFLGNKLHIFKNRTVEPDVLLGISDGMNDHEPDEPGFIPNVSITYAHLHDESKTLGQPAKDSDFYIAQDDPANGCAYPRHCVVSPMRVVREYAVNDGNGGQRKFGLRYRDGRYDRVTGEFLGFGKRILTDLDTGETTVDFYDNVTKVQIGAREGYFFAGQIQKQWQWVPGLPTQSNPQQVEMVFADRTIEVVRTQGTAVRPRT